MRFQCCAAQVKTTLVPELSALAVAKPLIPLPVQMVLVAGAYLTYAVVIAFTAGPETLTRRDQKVAEIT